MKTDVRRLLLSATAAALTAGLLWPAALSLPQHGDEKEYLWSAAYFGGRLARLDFSTSGSDWYTDPGWDPQNRWSLTQPMGARLLFAATMSVTDTMAPQLPYSWVDTSLQGPETEIPAGTLAATRLAAILCASAGLALISWRLGYSGLISSLLLLAIPHVRQDLSRAWAEGPLLLGLGLCVASYGTRSFPFMCALAATAKLTALAVWPLAVLRRAIGGLRPTVGLLATWGTWTALTPPAWFLGGPAYLLAMMADRVVANRAQSQTYGNVGGLFLETRYLWPFELAGLLILAMLIARLARRRVPAWPAKQSG